MDSVIYLRTSDEVLFMPPFGRIKLFVMLVIRSYLYSY